MPRKVNFAEHADALNRLYDLVQKAQIQSIELNYSESGDEWYFSIETGELDSKRSRWAGKDRTLLENAISDATEWVEWYLKDINDIKEPE